MDSQSFETYARLMRDANEALTKAKEASDRGDTEGYKRLLEKSIQLSKLAMAIPGQNREPNPTTRA